jgi:hypothetical protein
MKNIVLFMLLSLLINGCTRQANQATKIKIKFPEQTMSSQSTPIKKSTLATAAESSSWGLEAPVSVTASNCFAVFARVPEGSSSACVDTSGSTVLNVNRLSGMAAAGSTLEIELPTGKAREIGVFAFKSSDGSCANINEAINTKNFSAPLAVGMVTADLVAGEMQIPITLSMTGAKTIEKCSGDPLGSWPVERSCTPTIAKMISVGGGELSIEGSCLNPTTNLEILNSTTSETHELSIATKSDSKISAKLAKSLTMASGIVYHLVIKTAQAQVQAPITLQIGSGLSVRSNGVKVGTFLTTAYMMYQSTGILMTANNGSPAVYFAKHYNDGTGVSIVAKKYYLYPSLYTFNNVFEGLSLQDLLNANVITANYGGVSSMYFSGNDCTGDMLINAGATDILKGKYFIQPSSCDPNYPYYCTGQTPKKLTVQPTYQASFNYASYLYFDAMNTNVLKCYVGAGTTSGLVAPSTGMADLDATDAPVVIENTAFSP